MQESKKLAVIGFGELADQFSNLSEVDKRDLVVFDDEYKGECFKVYPFKDFSKVSGQFDWQVCLGYKHLELKKKIVNSIINLGGTFRGFIHPSGFNASSAKIHNSTVVYPMCNIDKGVELKAGVLINNSVVISHDSVIGECCYISPGVVISGNVKIGSCTFIGTGTVISNNVTIGDNVKIGVGSVITSDVPSNSSVIGSPMKILNKPLNLI